MPNGRMERKRRTFPCEGCGKPITKVKRYDRPNLCVDCATANMAVNVLYQMSPEGRAVAKAREAARRQALQSVPS